MSLTKENGSPYQTAGTGTKSWKKKLFRKVDRCPERQLQERSPDLSKHSPTCKSNSGFSDGTLGQRSVGPSHFSHVHLFATIWAVARQPPLSLGLSRQEYWSWLPCPPPGDLPNPGIEPSSFTFPALGGRFFTTSTTREAQHST